jgi:hypothetical protein
VSVVMSIVSFLAKGGGGGGDGLMVCGFVVDCGLTCGIGGAANIVKPGEAQTGMERGEGKGEKEKKSWWKGFVGGSGAGASGEEKGGREGSSSG